MLNSIQVGKDRFPKKSSKFAKPFLVEGIDLSKDPTVAKFEKIATASVVFAIDAGVIETLEGKVPYAVGDAILTGIQGEKWPVKKRVFDSLYELVPALGEGFCRKKSGASIYAKQMDVPFRVSVRNGEAVLDGKSGDWLVQFNPGEMGVVANEIFQKSYRRLS